jgi:hypothetical protein
MSTYPSIPNLPQGTNETVVNPANWNSFVDNINAIGTDLVSARSDNQVFPGTPHTPDQSININDILSGMKHMIVTISGEANWYNDTAASLKSHDHSVGKGGTIPWSSIGLSNHSIDLHPEYPGAVWTTLLRGNPPSGNNTVTRSTGQDVVSYISHNYYEVISTEVTLQDYYVGIRFTLPENFNNWAANGAIQIEYRTGSDTSINCGVDINIYKSGNASIVATNENNISINWSSIVIDRSSLGSWSSGDIMEIYIKLKSRNSYYARVGKISFNFTS